MFIKNRIAIAVVAALCGVSAAAQAETLTDFFKQSKIGGQIRSYYFSRDYGAAGPNQNAFSLGGILNVQTAPFLGGFGVGVSFYTANALGANNLSGAAQGYPHLDPTLMGPRQSINALGQAYIQYALPKVLLVRAGDQVINTPWVNNSDSRLLPATYQGVFPKFLRILTGTSTACASSAGRAVRRRAITGITSTTRPPLMATPCMVVLVHR